MSQFEYCKPISRKVVPTGPDWIHEVKYDGYRGRVVRDGCAGRADSRGGLLGILHAGGAGGGERGVSLVVLFGEGAVRLVDADRSPRRRVPNSDICLHKFLPILAHIIPPHLLHAGRLQALPRN